MQNCTLFYEKFTEPFWRIFWLARSTWDFLLMLVQPRNALLTLWGRKLMQRLCISKSIRFLHKHILSNTVVSLRWPKFFSYIRSAPYVTVSSFSSQLITCLFWIPHTFSTSPFWHYTGVSLVPHDSCVYFTFSVQTAFYFAWNSLWKESIKA
jgi:hypothetical protein